MASTRCVLIVLASYDYESLLVTLNGLDCTLNNKEKVVVILNGNQSLAARIVEYVARKWSMARPDTRFVIKPLSAPTDPFFAIKEVIHQSGLFKDAEYICKIDDDIIPLKKDWLQHLLLQYRQLSRTRNIGFVTGLININCWGFNELLTLYNKWPAYKGIHCYKTVAGWGGTRTVNEGAIDIDDFGTIWQYPFIARWVHEWTSLAIPAFLKKVSALKPKQIPFETYYSIGCMLTAKDFWESLDADTYYSVIDEKIIHNHCLVTQAEKWAVMNEPILHLFYNNHRVINSDLLLPVCRSLAKYFKDDRFVNGIVHLREQFSVALNNQSPKAAVNAPASVPPGEPLIVRVK